MLLNAKIILLKLCNIFHIVNFDLDSKFSFTLDELLFTILLYIYKLRDVENKSNDFKIYFYFT